MIALEIILGCILALILHELTHLAVLIYFKIPIKAIILTKYSAFGFLVDNEKYVNNLKILFLLHLLPLVWCLTIFIDPTRILFQIFLIFNLFGGLGDIYYFFKIILLSPEKRIKLLNESDEKILKTIIWKKEITPKNKIFKTTKEVIEYLQEL